MYWVFHMYVQLPGPLGFCGSHTVVQINTAVHNNYHRSLTLHVCALVMCVNLASMNLIIMQCIALRSEYTVCLHVFIINSEDKAG